MMRLKPLERHARLERGEPMRRTRMKRKPARRLARRAHLDDHGDYVRTLSCVCCGLPGPCEAAHITTSRNQKGMGMKVPDEQRVPLRRACHRAWDQHTGKFAGWTDEQRYELGAGWVRTTWLMWKTFVESRAA